MSVKEPCQARYPTGKTTVGYRGHLAKLITCNKPSGHRGNHRWDSRSTSAVAEWQQDGTVIR